MSKDDCSSHQYQHEHGHHHHEHNKEKFDKEIYDKEIYDKEKFDKEKEFSKKDNEWVQPLADARGSVKGSKDYDNLRAKEDAITLRKAMEGFSTDKGTIVEICGNRTFEQRRMIEKEYLHIDKEERDLIKELKSKLGGDLENLAVPLFMVEGEFDAILVEKTMHWISTDVELLNEILCTRTNKEMEHIKIAWQQKLNSKETLEEAVGKQTKQLIGVSHYHELCLKLLECKRPHPCKPEDKQVHRDAEDLHHLLSQNSELNNAKSKLVEIFTERSWPHIAAVVGQFQNLSEQWTMDGAIRHEFGESSHTSKALRTIAEFSSEPYDFWAKKLYEAMKGLGTDDSKLIRIIVTRCEVDMMNIAQVFGQRYGNDRNLRKWIEDDTSGFYRQLLLNLCGYY